MQLSDTPSAKKAVSKTVINLKKSAKELGSGSQQLDRNLENSYDNGANNSTDNSGVSLDLKPVRKNITSIKTIPKEDLDKQIFKNPTKQNETVEKLIENSYQSFDTKIENGFGDVLGDSLRDSLEDKKGKNKKEIIVSKTRNIIKDSEKTLTKKGSEQDLEEDGKNLEGSLEGNLEGGDLEGKNLEDENSDLKNFVEDTKNKSSKKGAGKNQKSKNSKETSNSDLNSASNLASISDLKSKKASRNFQEVLKTKKLSKGAISQKEEENTEEVFDIQEFFEKALKQTQELALKTKDFSILWTKKIVKATNQFYSDHLPAIGSTILFFICLSFFLSIDSGQFFGIEINRYQTTLMSLGSYFLFLNLFLIDSRFNNKHRIFVNFQSGVLVIFSFLYFIRSGNINFLIPDFINNYVVNTLKIDTFRSFSSSLIFMPLCFLIFIHNFYLYSKIKLPLIFTLIKIFIISLYTFYFLNFLEQDRTPDRDFNNFIYEFIFSLNDNILITIFALIISLTTYLNLKIKKTFKNAGLIMLFLALNFQLIWALNILKINSFSNFGYWHKSLVFMIVWDFGFAEILRKTTKAKDTERLSIKSNLSLIYHLILIAIVMITSV